MYNKEEGGLLFYPPYPDKQQFVLGLGEWLESFDMADMSTSIRQDKIAPCQGSHYSTCRAWNGNCISLDEGAQNREEKSSIVEET